jgi:hypothetical protein
LFTMSCNSNKAILIPPEKNLLLHISSDGFRECESDPQVSGRQEKRS